MRSFVLALGLLSACKRDAAPTPPPPPAPSGPSPTEVTVPGALHAVKCGDVTAIWSGTQDGPGPLWFFAESLGFQVGDAGVVAFTPPGDVYGPNRSFDIFSPDCGYVLLATDNYGPYHLVATKQLAAYLEGKVAPALVGFMADGGPARVHTDQKWLSPTELEFFAGCCGSVEVFRAKVSSPGVLANVFFAPSAPHGIRRTDRGFEAVP